MITFSTWQDDYPVLSFDQLKKFKDSFEWYYFDFDFKDGCSVVFLLTLQDNFVEENTPHLHIEYIEKEFEYKKKKLCSKEQFHFHIDEQQGIASIILDTGQFKIKRGKDNAIEYIDLKVEVGEVKIDFHIIPLHRGMKPTADGIYIRHEHNSELWTACSLIAPRVLAKGHITFKGKTKEVLGEGYHDHPWGTDNLVHTMGNWHWGRLFIKSATILFLWVLPAKNYKGDMIFCYYAPIQGETQTIPVVDYQYKLVAAKWKRQSLMNVSFPHTVLVESQELNIQIHLDFVKAILDLPGYNRSLFNIEVQPLKSSENGVSLEEKGTGWKEWAKFPFILRSLYGRLAHLKYSKWILNKKMKS
jgi:hypothetical protein